jgi:meiotic recombination protein SPO11
MTVDQHTINKLEHIVADVLEQLVIKKESPSISLPIRNASSIEVIKKEEDQYDFEEIETTFEASKNLRFTDLRSVKNFSCSMRLIKIMHELLQRNIHATKRDIYYSNVNLFHEQQTVDTLVDDFACKLKINRKDLHVIASSKGVISGNVQFKEDGVEVDCRKFQAVGKPITPFTEKITNIRSSATCMVIVEKDAVFTRLLEDGFCDLNGCIIITGRGYPDVATRSLVIRLLKDLPELRAFILVDNDPHGLDIANVYINGSVALSHYSQELTLPVLERNIRMQWIGLSVEDIKVLDVPDHCLIPLSSADLKKATDLKRNTAKQKNIEWLTSELDHIINSGKKAEIQSLCSLSLDFLSKTYLPHKVSQLLV